MFIGHYAPALVLKGKYKAAGLGALFIAVQFVDILFFPFDLLGLERYSIEHGYTEASHLNLAYYPYTHGLLSTLIWAALGYLLYKYVFNSSKGAAIAISLAVISHWVMDLIVHTKDLPLLLDNSPKVGLGLWHNKLASFLTESGLTIVALWYYLKNTSAGTSFLSKYGMSIFVLFMVFIGYLNMYVLPPPEDKVQLTISALFFYFLFAGIAWWLDGKRRAA